MSERDRVESRPDDFAERREHLKDLSDEQLQDRFWELTDRVVQPLVELAQDHTSPSIERSVLLRMGFSSTEAGEIVERVLDHGMLGKGAGHLVYKVAAHHNLSIREAGLALAEGEYWDDVRALFSEGGEC